MVSKKNTEVEKSSQSSIKKTSEDELLSKHKSIAFNNFQSRIQVDGSFNPEVVEKAVTKGVKNAIQENSLSAENQQKFGVRLASNEPVSSDSSSDSATENKTSESEKNRTAILERIAQLTEAEERSRKDWHEKTTSVVNFLNKGKTLSYGLTLAADSISPALGQAVHLAISNGMNSVVKSLWNSIKPDKASKYRQREISRLSEKLNSDIDTVSSNVNKSTNNKDSSVEVTENRQRTKIAEAVVNSSDKLDKVNASILGVGKSVRGIVPGIMGVAKALGIAAIGSLMLDYIFNDQFRATVNGYLLDFWKGKHGVSTFFTKQFARMSDTVKNFCLKILSYPARLFGSIGKTVGKASFNFIKALWNKAGDSISSWVAKSFSQGGWGERILSGIKNKLISSFNSVKSYFKNAVNNLGSYFNSLKNKLGVLGKSFSSVKSLFSSMTSKVKNALSGLKSKLQTLGDIIKNPFKSLGNLVDKLWSALSNVPIIGKFFKGASNVASVAKGKIGTAVNATKELVENFPNTKVGIATQKVLGSLQNSFVKSLGSISKSATSLFKALKFPGFATAVSLYSAQNRFKEGDTTGAALDTLSGVASMIPSVGTIASYLIDGYMLYRDLNNPVVKARENLEVKGNLPTSENVNTAQMESQRDPIKIVVPVPTPVQQQDAAIVNSIPTSPSTRPSIAI